MVRKNLLKWLKREANKGAKCKSCNKSMGLPVRIELRDGIYGGRKISTLVYECRNCNKTIYRTRDMRNVIWVVTFEECCKKSKPLE